MTTYLLHIIIQRESLGLSNNFKRLVYEHVRLRMYVKNLSKQFIPQQYKVNNIFLYNVIVSYFTKSVKHFSISF